MNEFDKRKVTSPENGKNGGVCSAEGKEISSRNAVKHGIFSKIMTSYDEGTFEEVYEGYAAEFGDETPSRRLLLRQLTLNTIRLQRCARLEAEALRATLNPPRFEKKLVRKGIVGPTDILDDKYETVLVEPGDTMVLDPSVLNSLDNIYAKYEAQFLSRIYKAIELLRRGEK